MGNETNIDTHGGAHIGGNVAAARDFIGRDQLNIAVHLKDVNDAARVVRILAARLPQDNHESESIRADLLGLMEELRRTHSTIVKSISPLRRIPDGEATFPKDFHNVYCDFRDFYDAYDFWDERTHCQKVQRIQNRLERHDAPIVRSAEWAQLRQNLMALGNADLDMIDRHYRPFMQRFNDVMVEIDRLLRCGDVAQAKTLKQVFLNELDGQFDGIKEMLRLMTATIGEIEASLP